MDVPSYTAGTNTANTEAQFLRESHLGQITALRDLIIVRSSNPDSTHLFSLLH